MGRKMVLLAQEPGERVKDFEVKEKVQCALRSVFESRSRERWPGVIWCLGAGLAEQSEGRR